MDDSHELNAKQECSSKGSRKKTKKGRKRRREVENEKACLPLKEEFKAVKRTKKVSNPNLNLNLNLTQTQLT